MSPAPKLGTMNAAPSSFSWLLTPALGSALMLLGCEPSDGASDTDEVGTTETTGAETSPDPETGADTEPTSSTGQSPGSHTVEVDGVEIAYEIAGQGEPAVVLIHGGLNTQEVWSDLVAELAPERRVITLDLPGHGESGTPAAFTPQAFTGAVMAVMDDAGVDEAALVGHSFGVWIARDVALAWPERVAGLVMVDGYVVPLGGDPSIGQALLMQFESDRWEAAAEDFIEQFMFGASTPDPVKDFVRPLMLAGSQALWIAIFTIAIDPALERDEVLERPTLAMLVPGAAMPPAYEQYLQDRFTPLTYTLEPEDAGHFVMLERPISFAQDVRGFVEAL